MLKHLYGIKQNNKYLLIQGILLIVLCLCLTGCSQKGRSEKKQLYYAISSPNIQGIKEAIKKDRSIVNEKMKTLGQAKPLELAVREIESEKIQLEICSVLIEAGADLNELGLDGNTNLCWAICNERIQLTEKLIEAGANVNQESEEGETPLRSTLSGMEFRNFRTKKKLMEKLRKAGAKPDAKLISYLLEEGNYHYGMKYYFIPKIMEWIPEERITDGVSPALYAAITGNDKELQKQLQSDNIKKAEKKEVLAFAAAYCDVETLKMMKQQGYDFSWKDSDKVGLLHIASLCNQKKVVDYLLDQGLKGSDKIDFYHADAVGFAVLGNHLDTAELLIQKGKVNYKDHKSDSDCPDWSFISAYGGEEALRSMIQLGYQPTELELYHTFGYGIEEQYQALVEIKGAIYAKDEEGSSVLSCPAVQEKGNLFYDLCRKGLKAEEDDLNSLIWLGRSDTVKKILEENMTKGRIRKEVLLQSAIDVGDFPMVRYLVKEGADINAYVKDEVENFKWTSMQMAYGRESVEIRKYLQKNGGDTTKKDSYGRSCKEIAKEAEAVWNLE